MAYRCPHSINNLLELSTRALTPTGGNMTDSVAATADDYSQDDEFLGHPKGLYVCFTTELWERFSFYGMKYLLLLYLTKYHLFTDEWVSTFSVPMPASSMRCR